MKCGKCGRKVKLLTYTAWNTNLGRYYKGRTGICEDCLDKEYEKADRNNKKKKKGKK